MNFLVPSDVDIYLVYSLSIIIFGGFVFSQLLTCGVVVLIVEYRTELLVCELGFLRILADD